MTPRALPTPQIIDEQHLRVERLISELDTTIVLGSSKERIAEVARHLSIIVAEHFRSEECMLAAAEYDGLPEHVAEHLELCKTFMRLYEALELENFGSVLFHLRSYKDQLREHMQTADEKYRSVVDAYAARIGASPLPKRIFLRAHAAD